MFDEIRQRMQDQYQSDLQTGEHKDATPIDYLDWAKEEYDLNLNSLPCHFCGAPVSIEELDENGAYTYPDNFPFCPNCQHNNQI